MGDAIQAVTVYILPIIFAITLHEAAHGYVARYFGDSTAYLQGRISLNPLRHIDLVGTILIPIFTLLITVASGVGIMFGWAKPVPVNFSNLRHPKADMLWVALAGPAMNLAMAILWALFLKGQITLGSNEEFFRDMAVVGVRINLMFMLLNLVPILPLDGGRVVFSLLPQRAAWQFSKLEPYGLVILMALLLTRVLSSVLLPVLQLLVYLVLVLLFQIPDPFVHVS